jgi:hypothetical protein
MKKEINIDLETRLMMAEIGLKVAEIRIESLVQKIEILINQNRNR